MTPQNPPAWVSEGSMRKYVRAIDTLNRDNAARKAAGQPEVALTEEAVKELYVKYAGLVLEVEKPKEKEEVKTLEDLTVKELKALAEEKQVDLDDAVLKADIIDKLAEAGIE